MYREIHIFDLDGTLIDSSHRYRTMPCGTRIDLPYWIENCTPEKIRQDTLLPLAEFYHACVADPEIYVIIATCRLAKQADIDYVNEHLSGYNKFIYNQGELPAMKGAEFKGTKLRFINNLKQFKNAVKHFWEDNLDYLHGVGYYIPNLNKHYIESKQGY